MIDKIKIYKNLFQEKKFQEIINDIEKSDYNNNPQLLHILGISKSFKSRDKKTLISAKKILEVHILLIKI